MKVQFHFKPDSEEGIESVHLVGSFNQWSTLATKMEHQVRGWEHTLDLPEGFYPYKYLINGKEWQHDPMAVRFEQNEVGSINSIAVVQNTPTMHATFSPLHPSYDDTITIYSDRPASLVWSINGWNPWPKGYLRNTIPNLEMNVSQLEKASGTELYHVTLGPFNRRTIPEVIVYSFVFPDGTNDDNFGKNYWLPLDLKIGGLCTIDTFKSTALDQERPFRIFTPSRKSESGKYPLLLLLHGYGGTHLADWTQADVVKMLADRYGMICVWPDGGVFAWGETVPGWYINSPRIKSAQMEEYIIKELLPYVESNYPCSGQKAVGGISMGGFGAFYLATRYAGTFRAAASFSSIYNLYRYRKIDALRKLMGDETAWKKNQFNVIKLVSGAKETDFFFLVGDEERGAMRDNFNLKLAMDKAGIRHEFRIYPGNHANNFWRVHIQEMMEFFALHLGCAYKE
jgi:S-formylglutathione hydrolase FrmB